MAKAELGTKRTCPETGKNFYDLNKDPVVSPYTGKSYPLSFFELAPKPTKESRKAAKPGPEAEDEDDEEIENEDAEKAVVLDDEDEDIEETEVAKELGDDADEVVLEGATDEDEDDTTKPGKVPAGFQDEGVDDDDDDVILDSDDDDFEIDGDDDIVLEDDIVGKADDDKS